MLGILTNVMAPKGSTPGAQNAEAGAADMAEGLASFGALMTQVLSAEGATEAAPNGKLAQLATMLGKFREMAQDSLAEAFPDGVITPGPEFDAWAKSMLTQLDGMLQGIGAGLGDLAQVLGTIDGAKIEGLGQGTGTLLAQSVQVLTGATQNMDLSQPADLGDFTASLTPDAGEGPSIEATAKAMLEAVTKGTSSLTEVDLSAAVDAMPDTSLPDPLRVLLAQVMAAPADRALPPEIQAILSAQPQAAAPVADITAVAPAPQQGSNPAQPNGFARNLAGQIRGVSFAEGTTRIELTPHGLGRMEIEIAPDEAGKLRVVIRAENPAVLNALRSDREMLAGLLRDGGASVDDSAMSFEEFGQRQNAAPSQEAGGTLATAGPVEDEDEAVTSDAVIEDGRLNILT